MNNRSRRKAYHLKSSMSTCDVEPESRKLRCMVGKGDIKGSEISGTALKPRIKQTKVSGLTNSDEISFRWRI